MLETRLTVRSNANYDAPAKSAFSNNLPAARIQNGLCPEARCPTKRSTQTHTSDSERTTLVVTALAATPWLEMQVD